MRVTVSVASLLIGLALALVGFLLAAPIGETIGPHISDPRVPFASGLLIIGIALMFGSAFVYEAYPNGRQP